MIFSSRRQNTLWVLALALPLALPLAVHAQTIRDNGPAQPNVLLQFNGTISTTVMLTVTGGGPTTLSGTTVGTAPTAATGTINFGTFSTQTPASGSNADRYRVTSGTAGAVLAATLSSTVLYNGNVTASITVARKVAAGALPDLPLGNVRVASPPLASWTAGTNGTSVPNPGSSVNICTLAGDATCINDKTYTHQLAVFIPDTQAAGPFSTTVVYTATSP